MAILATDQALISISRKETHTRKAGLSRQSRSRLMPQFALTPATTAITAVSAFPQPAEEITEPFRLMWNPHSSPLRLHLLVDHNHNRGTPINRTYDMPQLCSGGKVLTEQHDMRRNLVKSVSQYLADVPLVFPGRTVRAFLSNGNLLANYEFVAWTQEQLYHLADEPIFRRSYTALVSWRDGSISVEDIWFARENGSCIVLRSADGSVQDISEMIEWLTSGQPLVRCGAVIPLEQQTERWYDTRHPVRPICIRLNTQTLYVPNAQLQQGLLHKALCCPVHIRPEAQVDEKTVLPLTIAGLLKMHYEDAAGLAQTETFLQSTGILSADESLSTISVLARVAQQLEHLLLGALRADGYGIVDCGAPLKEGQARFVNNYLEIFFKKAVYPHNVFVRWADGRCGFVVWPGKSGRSGTTLPFAQHFLAERLKVQDAVLLDNGGDVRLSFRGQYLLPSSENREELRSLLVLTAPEGEWCDDVTVS